ncbi:TPA: hypothetical protein U2R15_004179 [Klebsiella aerogenes]|nr:hypothetical protein [Klebsiella aerogenes]
MTCFDRPHAGRTLYFVLVALSSGLMTGCAQEFKPVVTPRVGSASPAERVAGPESVAPGSVPTSAPSGTTASASAGNASRLEQCTRELDALKQFNNTKYTSYKAELDRITRTGAQYLQVAGGISQDINDLVQPRYQYALTSLCQRVRADLSASLINQVSIK